MIHVAQSVCLLAMGWTVWESNSGRVGFSAHSWTGPGAYPASFTMGNGPFPGVKWPGAWRWPPTPSSAEVKGRVRLQTYSPSGPSWPLRGRIVPNDMWDLIAQYKEQFVHGITIPV